MPGGQYTNLREQATALGLGKRWPDVVKTYQQVNQLLGDIVRLLPVVNAWEILLFSYHQRGQA